MLTADFLTKYVTCSQRTVDSTADCERIIERLLRPVDIIAQCLPAGNGKPLGRETEHPNIPSNDK
jgi:hypothetical protein